MAEEGAEAGEQAEVRPPQAGDQHGGRALQHVEQEGGGGEPLVAGAQHVGGADVAGADLAHVAQPGGAGEQQAEGDRAENVAEDERGQQRPVECHVVYLPPDPPISSAAAWRIAVFSTSWQGNRLRKSRGRYPHPCPLPTRGRETPPSSLEWNVETRAMQRRIRVSLPLVGRGRGWGYFTPQRTRAGRRYAENTVRPATMVRLTRPWRRAPSKQVFLERERMASSLTIHGSSRSTSARSAGAPGASVPPGRP